MSTAQECFFDGVSSALFQRYYQRQTLARRRGIDRNTVKMRHAAYVDRVALRYWNLVLNTAFLAGAISAADLVLQELNGEA